MAASANTLGEFNKSEGSFVFPEKIMLPSPEPHRNFVLIPM